MFIRIVLFATLLNWALAIDAIDSRLPIPVTSSALLTENYHQLKKVLSNEDSQAYAAAESYLSSYVNMRPDLGSQADKDHVISLLAQNGTPRQIIVLGHLLFVARLDVTLAKYASGDGKVDPNQADYILSVVREATNRKAAALETVRAYSKVNPTAKE